MGTGVIDIDPGLLRESAAAARHAGAEAWIHMHAEFAGDIDKLMETLVDQAPYAYTIMPQVSADGAVRSPVMTTWQEVHDCYKLVRGRSDLLRVEPFVEMKGSFYVFHDCIGYGRIKATGYENPEGTRTLAIFPVGKGKGITGELVWAYVPRDKLGTGPAPDKPMLEGRAARQHNLIQHEAYLEALRANDVEAVLATMNDGIQANIRDLSNATGTLVGADGKDAYRTYLDAFFARYVVLSVDHIHRIAEDWYVFAEVRFAVREKATGRARAWTSAEFLVPAKDNRFIVQTGHATDPA